MINSFILCFFKSQFPLIIWKWSIMLIWCIWDFCQSCAIVHALAWLLAYVVLWRILYGLLFDSLLLQFRATSWFFFLNLNGIESSNWCLLARGWTCWAHVHLLLQLHYLLDVLWFLCFLLLLLFWSSTSIHWCFPALGSGATPCFSSDPDVCLFLSWIITS